MGFNFRTAMKRYVPKSKENAKICLYGTGDNWNCIRRMFKSFCNIELENQVDYFVDGNPARQGKYIGNTKIISPDEVDISDCVIFITSNRYEHEIGIELAKRGLIGCLEFYDSFYITSILFEYIIEQTMNLRDTQRGNRCFVIGNGPSLTACDLDILKKNRISSFGMNRIFKIFDKTEWRPTYYVACDYYAVKNYEEYNAEIDGVKFINATYAKLVEEFHTDNAYYFMANDTMLLLSHLAKPIVSDKIYDLNSGGTTLFIALQLAFYLGFSEIYLLGADNSFIYEKSNDGELIVNGDVTKSHFVDDYLPRNSHSGLYDAQFGYQTIEAYKSAVLYAKERGIIFKNATRGGKLDVVERVDFDTLFGGEIN